MALLVCYSLYEPPAPSSVIARQLATSLATLRDHSPAVDVVLFCYGDPSTTTRELCRRYRVEIHECGSYARRLAALCPDGAPALVHLPTLHKLLNFTALAAAKHDQVLCCDSDTVFLRDVEPLASRYAGADVVAREEVFTSRCAHGVDPSFVDERTAAAVAAHVGAVVVPPFNTGVILYGNQVWRRLARLEPVLLDYGWRFLLWTALRPASGRYGSLEATRVAAGMLTPARAAHALPFPSDNPWLVEEAATWLGFGHVPGLLAADFSAQDVAQDGEFAAHGVRTAPWTLCHYFSHTTDLVHLWMSDHAGALTSSEQRG